MQFYIFKFILFYLVTVAIFVIDKIAFMLLYPGIYGGLPFSDKLAALYHGLPMDLSTAGYLTIIPGLLIIGRIWSMGRVTRILGRIYVIMLAILLAAIFTLDAGLYGYWGFKLDTTPLFYFISSPSAVIGGMTWWQSIGGLVLWGVSAFVIYLAYRFTVMKVHLPQPEIRPAKTTLTVTISILTALLFIPIRGGVTVSTMNLSTAYFSQNQRLNHAAINPAFSLLYSLSHRSGDYDNLNFFDRTKLELIKPQVIQTESSAVCDTLRLSTPRPDIYIIILESFSSHLLTSQSGEPIAPQLDSIARSGLLFTNFYANNFRTDRALPSVLNGYPGIPPVSVMKYVDKIENLPSLPKSLKDEGYDLTYYYGGDVNFTNMLAFLVAGGFEKIVRDKDFPMSQRLGKWGAHDDVLFSRVENDFGKRDGDKPLLRVIQTSSSHEPFKVPFNRLENPAANAFAYTDSIVGHFINKLRSTPEWDNTLVVLVPDHYGAYPKPLESMRERHHVPLIFTGGALKQTGKVATPGSQADIAATLLAMLGIDHSQFPFSKDMFDPSTPKFAYFVEPELAGIVDDKGYAVLNVISGDIEESAGADPSIDHLKAFLQLINTDFQNR